MHPGANVLVSALGQLLQRRSGSCFPASAFPQLILVSSLSGELVWLSSKEFWCDRDICFSLGFSVFLSRNPKARTGAPKTENSHCAVLVREVQGRLLEPRQVREQAGVLLPAPVPCQAPSFLYCPQPPLSHCHRMHWLLGKHLHPDLHTPAASRPSWDVCPHALLSHSFSLLQV